MSTILAMTQKSLIFDFPKQKLLLNIVMNVFKIKFKASYVKKIELNYLSLKYRIFIKFYLYLILIFF